MPDQMYLLVVNFCIWDYTVWFQERVCSNKTSFKLVNYIRSTWKYIHLIVRIKTYHYYYFSFATHTYISKLVNWIQGKRKKNKQQMPYQNLVLECKVNEKAFCTEWEENDEEPNIKTILTNKTTGRQKNA